MEQDILLQDEWYFIKKDMTHAQEYDFDTENWEKISLPHTWNNKDVQNGGGKIIDFLGRSSGYYRGPGWYRKSVYLSKDYNNKRLFLKFEAAGSVADVFFNGHFIGKHIGAFAAFTFEITSLLKIEEKNIIAVRVDNSKRKDVPPLSGDFPVMGGLYRNVHLLTKNQVCITPLDYSSSGVYLKQTSVSKTHASIDVLTKLSIMDKSIDDIKLKISLLDDQKSLMQEIEQNLKIKDQTNLSSTQRIEINEPRLWNGKKDPYLYYVKVSLEHMGELLDEVIQPLGIRFFHVDPKKGFFLNGEHYNLYGVAKHQDKFNKGWALTKEDLEEDLHLIQEIGARAVRLAHYQHPEYFYQLCDQSGILVWAEISLVNTVKFNDSFWKNTSTMLIELIRQNYNHPSIFTWGLCNELGLFQFKDPSPVVLRLNKLAHEEDPTRPTTFAAIMLAIHKKKLNNITDLSAVNLYPGWYRLEAENMKDEIIRFNKIGNLRGIAISEYGAGGSIKQHGDHDKVKPMGKWHPEDNQAKIHEINYKHIFNSPYVWGSFVWNMFDFAVATRNEGDTPGRNDKGLVTYDRKVRKDVFFFYKANWTTEPMVYITNRRYIEHTESITDIKVYSNCDKVELTINGKSCGEMSYQGFGIFKISNCSLTEGDNIIEASGFKTNIQIKDSCIWKYQKV